MAQHALQRGLENRALVAAVRVELQKERVEAKQRRHHQDATVAVLDVRAMHESVQKQPSACHPDLLRKSGALARSALRVYEQVALLALDLLAGIVPGRVDRDPPFSALLTLWLSMIAAVGLASLPAASRHCT